MGRSSGGIPQVLTSRDNPIINGGFELWQRGSSFTGITNEAYMADRFKYSKGGTIGVVRDVTQISPPAVAALVPYSGTALQINATSADNTLASGEYEYIAQNIEGYIWAPLWQKQFTLGFWVRSNVIGTYCVAFRSTGADKRCYIAEYTIIQQDVWEYKTIIVPASPASGSWNVGNGVGLELSFVTACHNATLITTPGAWNTGNFLATTSQTNNAATINNKFALWGICMNIGPTVQPYWPRLYEQELALCQRYTYVPPTGMAVDGQLGFTYGSAQMNIIYDFPVVMRSSASFTHNNTLTNIGTTGDPANGVLFENQRIQAAVTGGTFSSWTQWQAGQKRFITRLNSSTSFTNGATGDAVFAYFNSLVKPVFTAEL